MKINKILQHNALQKFPLEDSCIDVCITSPPYWGLRDYGEQVTSIFGGNPSCEHIFTEYHSKLINENRQNLDGGTIGNDKFREKLHGFGTAIAGFCSRCGAWKGQFGLEPYPQLYIEHLVCVTREIKRVLKKTGSFYLNLGDTYCGSGKGYGSPPDPKWGKARDGQLKPSKIYDNYWLQPKQLMLIPSRVAIALQEEGWILRNDIIWHKPNPMPSSVKDRLNNTFEHIFHFVKNRRYYFDLDSIREPHSIESLKDLNRRKSMRFITDKNVKSASGKTNPCDKWDRKRDEYYHPDGKNPGDVIDWNIKEGNTSRGQPRIQPNRSISQTDEFRKNRKPMANNPNGKNPGDFWSITTQPFTSYNPSLEHFAVFPEELVEKPLKASCPKDGVVLDPFCGRGTVGKVAKKLGLNYILFDVKPEYVELSTLYVGGQKRKLISHQQKLEY